MKNLTIYAKAKINLSLEIFDKREDGYHDIRSVMHKIGLFDKIDFEVNENDDKNSNDAGEIRVICTPEVCSEKDNLAYKAAESFQKLYYKKTGKVFSAKINIEKGIPDKAGLGGGSADCAAVIDGLCKLLGVVSESEADDLCCMLGSDVPFMREKYDCALAHGTGTTLEKLPMMPVCYCVIGVPDTGLSTREIYELFDQKKNGIPKVKVNSLISALEKEDFCGVCDNICNQFEKICVEKLSEIGEIKKSLLENGAYAAQMSGSGSAVFGIFSDKEKAAYALEKLSDLPFNVRKYLCKI